MLKVKEITVLWMLGLIVLAGPYGCMGPKKTAVNSPTCSQALAGDLESLSDHEIATVLNDASPAHALEECWIPLVKGLLEQNRDIPRVHLVKALKLFNKRQYEAYFHKALYRYFADITKNPGRYRPEDRILLESYFSYLINSAESNRDKNLRQAKLLCRKLDRNLYARLFQ